MKNKNGQSVGIPQTKRKLGSAGLIDRARARVVSCQYNTWGRLDSDSWAWTNLAGDAEIMR